MGGFNFTVSMTASEAKLERRYRENMENIEHSTFNIQRPTSNGSAR
jgi:hypothetical protein